MATSDSPGSSPAPEGNSNSPSPDKFEWLLNEYKLLSDHSRHEDSELKKTLLMFLTINSGLLGFAASSLAKGEEDIRWLFPIVGLLLWLPWIPSMVRIRAYRNYFENRVRKIETELQ